MAFTLLGTPAVNFAAGSATTIATAATAHTGGSLLVVNVGWESSLVTVTVADSAGNIYVPLTTRVHTGVGQWAKQFYVLICNNHPSNIVTVTYSGAVTFRSVHIAQWRYEGPIAFDSESFSEVTGVGTQSFTVTPTNNVYSSSLIYMLTKSFAPTAHTNTVGSFTDGNETDADMQQWYRVTTSRLVIPTTFTFATDDVLTNWAIFRETYVKPMMGQACLV